MDNNYLINLKPGKRVRYLGKSSALNRGSWYTIETNFIKNNGIFIKVQGCEAQFPGEHFEGELLNLNFKRKI